MEPIDDLMLRIIQVHNQWFYEGRFKYWYFSAWGQAMWKVQAKRED
jgi:hypothetical protein